MGEFGFQVRVIDILDTKDLYIHPLPFSPFFFCLFSHLRHLILSTIKAVIRNHGREGESDVLRDRSRNKNQKGQRSKVGCQRVCGKDKKRHEEKQVHQLEHGSVTSLQFRMIATGRRKYRPSN